MRGGALVAVVASLVLLTACSGEGAAPQAPTAPPLAYSGLPLPPGAQVDPAGIRPGWDNLDDDSWPGSLRPDAAVPAERVPEILERGRLIVGVDQSQYLLSFRDSAHGELRGFEIDLAREIARDIFGDPTKVDFRFVESSKRVASLDDATVDIIVRTMSITPERVERVEFSTPYLTSSVRLLTRLDGDISGPADAAGATICVVDGTNLVELARSVAPDSKILRTRSWSDCLMASQLYQSDAVLADDAILAGMTAQDPLTEVLPTSYGTQRYAVAVRKGNDGLVRQVNSTLERIRDDGTWNKMFATWLGASSSTPALPPIRYRDTEGGQ
ncbi:glutamate ABC transporter substrate-binding protein [Corynebacterium sp. LK2510]|uniref:glutamate ABC transporter substrate-binding protein n=1 Tax=Corynebacterium sp. LK2510 TaxID=3110472 RepID=UPI0034CE86CA